MDEAFEESRLQVQITEYLGDLLCAMSITRYFWARSSESSQAAMGLDSYASILVLVAMLRNAATDPTGAPIAQAIKRQG